MVLKVRTLKDMEENCREENCFYDDPGAPPGKRKAKIIHSTNIKELASVWVEELERMEQQGDNIMTSDWYKNFPIPLGDPFESVPSLIYFITHFFNLEEKP